MKKVKKMTIKNIVIFDLDGTLCDITHRRHHVTGLKRDWDKFTEEHVHDKLAMDIAELLLMCHNSGMRILLFSGRMEGTKDKPFKYRESTIEWLNNMKIPYHELRMRKAGDYQSDDTLKAEMVKDIVDQVLFVVDDRDQVVKMWRSIGLTCLQCAPGDF